MWELIDRPGQSPTWILLNKFGILDSKIDHTNVSLYASLWEQLETIWNSIAKETVESIKTMPSRMQAVMKEKGGHTKYYVFGLSCVQIDCKVVSVCYLPK